jgi:hypothetical protein
MTRTFRSWSVANGEVQASRASEMTDSDSTSPRDPKHGEDMAAFEIGYFFNGLELGSSAVSALARESKPWASK